MVPSWPPCDSSQSFARNPTRCCFHHLYRLAVWARNGQLGPSPAGLTARCDPGCVFSHPSPRDLTVNIGDGDYVCPFGSACLEKKCPFLHLSGKARVLDIAYGNLVCGRVDQPFYFKDVVRPAQYLKQSSALYPCLQSVI